MSSTKNESKFPKTCQFSSRKFLVAVDFFFIQHFCNQKVIVMGDEKYFTFSQECMVSGPTTMLETLLTPLNTKLLACIVWCGTSEVAVFTLFIGTSKGQTVDADVYITKCLPKMVKFIEKHHKNDETIFWLELASCYYAK
jgi:hypothetical protein